MKKVNNSINIEKPLENNKNQKKKHGFWYYFLNVLIWGVVAAGVIYSSLNIADKRSGYTFLPSHTAVIVSDSMSKVNEANLSYLDPNVEHICKYDVIHTSNYSSYEDVKLLDIVIYYDQSGNLICHRVIEKYQSEGKNYLITRGDANNVSDTPFEFSIVRGKVTKVDKGVGQFILFLQSPYFLLALCFGGFFAFLGAFIFDFKKEKNEPALKTNANTNEKITEEKEVDNHKESNENKSTKIYKYKCPKCGAVVEYKFGETASICPKCGTLVRRQLRQEETKNEENK